MKKSIIILLAVCTLFSTSCNKWLDVNTDPNTVSSVSNGLLLTGVEMNLMTNYGLYAGLTGSYFAEHFAVKPKGPNTMMLAQWNNREGNSSATNANNFYRYSYVRVINNCKDIRKAAEASESWGDYLAATVLRDFTYQALVDMFGEVPYTEAENTSVTSPVYDEGKDVYAAIYSDLADAVDKVNKAQEEGKSVAVCDNMLFNSSSSVQNWIEFANALKLRILMRGGKKAFTEGWEAKLSELVGEDEFPANDIKFASSLFTNQAGKDNPLFEEFVRAAGDVNAGITKDICGHMAVMGAMAEVDDPRIQTKFNEAGDGGFEGNFIDTQQSIETGAGYLTEYSFAEPVLNYNTPIYLLTVAETEFFLAEYYSQVAPNAAAAKQHYEAAIEASFNTEGLDTEGASVIYGAGKYAWDAAKAMELIGIQKWIALANINGFEGWCEVRRTGYPVFNPVSGADVLAYWSASVKGPDVAALVDGGVYTYATLLTPPNVAEINPFTMIQRLRYPQSSMSTNSNIPAQKTKNDKIFWAK